jgi:hypothetical protein
MPQPALTAFASPAQVGIEMNKLGRFYWFAAGSTDDDANGATPCVYCNAGAYTRSMSVGQCDEYLCPVGLIDSDKNASTPCLPCDGITQYQSVPGQTVCLDVTQCSAGLELIRVCC